MKHASLFSGIGGFDLAAEWMGWDNVFHCEWMEFPRKILDYYWPNADSHVDICNTDFTKYANTIDILTGGFPCQPFSMAGKRKGTKDERYLWHEMLRAIQEIKPTYVIAENVFGITNIDGGLVFEQVCLDLEVEGYEVQPFVIPAAAKNAPHRRDRVWFVAHSKSNGRKKYGQGTNKWEKYKQEGNTIRSKFTPISKGPNVTHTHCGRLEGTKKIRRYSINVKWESKFRNAANTNGNGFNKRNGNDEIITGKGRQYAQRHIEQSNVNGHASNSNGTNNKTRTHGQILGQPHREKTNGHCNVERSNQWQNFPTQSPICSGDDVFPTKLDGITFSKWRAESIKGYGNAIVPQVAFEIFKAIEKTT